MKSDINSVRCKFLDFFEKKGHKILPGSSLIPGKEISLLFTNAGMNQFVDYFLGYKKFLFSRVVTSQYCLRAGGKHNDFNRIGYTNFHNTFFEMLGNFSFSDYFKREAIFYAWELLTDVNNFNLSKDRLLVTVYYKDYESYKIWFEDIGIKSDHIITVGSNSKEKNECFSDNFWHMDNIGPCGPCTEIFYDTMVGHSKVNLDANIINSNRFIEIWNIVFIQFNRNIDGSLIPLKVPLVDTGMGLERIVSVLQNVSSVYEIDLFHNIIVLIADLVNCNDLTNLSLRVIADHLRSCIFIIHNGIYPSNDKHGYILRKLLRRAIIHGYMLGVQDIFLYKLVDSFIYYFKLNYYHIEFDVNNITFIIKCEEENFSNTLKKGFLVLNKELMNLKSNILNGKSLFKLYDTYGFPLYLTKEICLKNNISVDLIGFKNCMLEQQNKSRVSNKRSMKFICDHSIISNYSSVFDGYINLKIASKILLIFVSNKIVNEIYEDQNGIIILDRTSFFYESSGQISDVGFLKNSNGVFKVSYTQKYGNIILHIGVLISGVLFKSDKVYASVDRIHRMYISINHSSTHLLHSALRTVLGTHVLQRGSFIDNKYFRFDFSHDKSLTFSELCLVEEIVNDYIRKNISVCTTYMNLNEIKLNNVIALFEEKYHHDILRVIRIGDISSEVCLGTHVRRTGDIGIFKVISEKGVSLGVRRIESLTGEYALSYVQSLQSKINLFMKTLNTNLNCLENKLISIMKNYNIFRKYYKEIERNKLNIKVNILKDEVEIVKDINLLFSYLVNTNINLLYKIINILVRTSTKMIIFLFTNIKDDYFFIFYVNEHINYLFDVNKLIDFLINKINCRVHFKSNIGKCYVKNNGSINNIMKDIKCWIINML